ncbi:MAG: OmpH family outer membrane protein [Planctomycetes bacterium]|nr:OmpH family outer membrane protein [Planctomycetota bacterium]
MKKIVIMAGGLAVLTAAYLGQLLAQTPATPPAQTRVAFVNIVTVFQNYTKASTYKQEMEALLKPIKDKGERLKAEIMKWQQDLQNDPKVYGDPTKREQYEQGILKNKRDLEDLGREAQRLVGKKNEEQVVQLYKEVNEAVKRHAQQQGFHIVLAYGENQKSGADPLNFANISRKVQGMEMGGAIVPMYMADGLDISMAVADSLNRTLVQAGYQKQ